MIKRIAKKIKNVGILIYHFLFTNKTRWLTVRIIVLSAYYRACILLIPMKKLENRFGERGKESPTEETYENGITAYWIGKKVERTCAKTSWKSLCLVRALIAQKLLHEKHISTTLYLGVGKEDGKMVAHAWLRSGTYYVTGGNGTADGYVMVAKFYR